MRLKSTVLGVVMAAALALAPQVQAAVTYEPLGSFGTEGYGYLQFGAVDEATGNVLRYDQGDGLEGVQVFATDGSSGTLLTKFGGGELGISAAVGIAVDQSSHAVYVSDVNKSAVSRWTSDGLPVPTYTRDLTYAGPAAGGGTGEIGAFGPIEVDPRNGDLLVADMATNRINRYSSSGAFLGSIDGSGAPNGAFHMVMDLAIDDAGDVYVIDAPSGPPQYGGATVVERYGADGSWKESLESVRRPIAIAYDAAREYVLVANVPGFGQTVYIDIFDDGERVGSFTMPAERDGSSVSNLAVDGATGRLYVFSTENGTRAIDSFAPVDYPDMTIDPPSAVTDTTAHLSGTIDPLGDEVTYRFQHSTDGTTWQSTPDEQLSAPGDPVPVGPVAVEADLTGLTPNRGYQVRLSVTTADGTFTTGAVALSTDTAAPSATTGPALDRTPTTATLRGTVDPFGLQATYRFEYGTTTAYGSRAPASRDAVGGGGQGARHVAQAISGLVPGTTYHYRLVATSSSGTRAGADRTFTTLPVGEVRAYEQVSPVDKGGSNVNVQNVQSSPSGDAVAFEWSTAPGGAQPGEAAPQYPRGGALRSPTAWTAFTVEPPQSTSPAWRQPFNTAVMAVSPDGRKALVTSLKKLADGAVEGDSNLYVRDMATNAYTTVVSVPGELFVGTAQSINANPYVGGTRDWSHILITWTNGSLVEGDPAGALYDFTGGELRLVSVDPSGNKLGGVIGGSSQNQDHGSHHVSADGSRIAFSYLEADGSGYGPVYVRVNGTETVPVSVSERAEDAASPVRPGVFAGASADGRYVYLSSGAPLTDDGGTGLFEVDVNDGDVTLIAPGVNHDDVSQVAAHGRTVYFLAGSAMTPDDVDDTTSLYVWRAGQPSYIAEGRASEFMASPSGRYFAFTSYVALTDYDTSTQACSVPSEDYEDAGIRCRAAYRYDADTDELLCASCRPDGKRLTGSATFNKPGSSANWGGHYFSRAVVDDGTVFFDTPDPLSAHDANSKRDVYSFDGEQATLISAGTGEAHSRFGDVSADGRSVFITTQDRLVGQDGDSFVDLYVARLGGGLPSQGAPPSAPVPCDQGCQDDARSPQERTLPSATLRGSGDVGSDRPASARFAKLSASVRARLARTGRARIAVRVNRAGRVSVRARARLSRGSVTVARGSTVARRAGLATVTLKLSRPARRALASRGKLTLRLSLTLAGRPTAKVRLDLRRPAQARRATAPTTTKSGR